MQCTSLNIFWKGNEPENPYMISFFLNYHYFSRKLQKNNFFDPLIFGKANKSSFWLKNLTLAKKSYKGFKLGTSFCFFYLLN